MPRRPKVPQTNAVRRHRALAELTQAELAARVGVSRQTIVAVENGGYAPSVYLALDLATHLGTTVERLFGAPPPPPSSDGPTVAAVEPTALDPLSTGGAP